MIRENEKERLFFDVFDVWFKGKFIIDLEEECCFFFILIKIVKLD